MTKNLIVLLVCVFPFMPAFSETPISGKVLGDRVNVRAKPSLSAEVTGQVNAGDVLDVLSLQDEWVEVRPPDSMEFWVHRDFITDNRVSTKKLNVRAGAGINYSVVGQLKRDDEVDVRGDFGEWLKIGPPGGASVYVSRSLMELIHPASPLPLSPVQEPALLPEEKDQELADSSDPLPPLPLGPGFKVDSSTEPSAPKDLKLIPLDGQGRQVQREGEVKRTPMLLFGKPSNFRLIVRSGNVIKTVCYLRGNSRQLESLLGENLLVHGREYWVEGVDQPVVVVEKIEKRIYY